MGRALPLSIEFRESYILGVGRALDDKDPLSFFQRYVFAGHPQHWANISHDIRTPLDFYRNVVRYCELSAWSEEPPLIIALLLAFQDVVQLKDTVSAAELISQIRNDGPYRGHPPGVPLYVARVSAEAPVLDRRKARIAALGFDPDPPPVLLKRVGSKRVLMVKGDDHPCLPSTLAFFRYLAAIQPEKHGVLYLDLGRKEMVTQAASLKLPIEFLMACDLEQQVRHVREGLKQREAVDAGELYDDEPEKAFEFDSRYDLQQRARWTRQLAQDFVDKVLFRADPDGRPQCWVSVFDNCRDAQPEAQEFVRRLVEFAAGTGPDDVEKALKRQLRIVLVGDGQAMLPSPLYTDHVVEEDLTEYQFGIEDLKTYYTYLGGSLGLDLSKEQILAFSQNSLARCNELLTQSSPPPSWVECMVRAALEQTAQLELQAAKKGAKV